MKIKREVKTTLELTEGEVKWLKKAAKLPLTDNECASDYEIRMRFHKILKDEDE